MISMRGFFYRAIMRLSHKFHWHYAPPIYPDGDTMLWCKWCGFRDIIARKGDAQNALSKMQKK